jgi:hypothetical protein
VYENVRSRPNHLVVRQEINKRLNRDEETDSWDIVKDGAPNGETSSDVSKRADQFIALTNEKAAGKVRARE